MSQPKAPLLIKPAPPPDWLTAQTQAARTAKPAKPKAAYKRRYQRA